MACHPRRRPGLLDQALRTPASTGQRRSGQLSGRLTRHFRRGHPIGQGAVYDDAVAEEHAIIVEIG